MHANSRWLAVVALLSRAWPASTGAQRDAPPRLAFAGHAGAPTPTFLVHGFFKIGFFVDDLDAAVATLRARGVTTLGDVVDGNGGSRFVLFRDNAGNFLQLFQRRD